MIFLKLGGSLITDKAEPEAPRLEALSRLAGEIAEARTAQPALQLLLGHGSGSFGHRQAARYGTQAGARSKEEWLGFQQVWSAAHRLHRHVLDALAAAEIPAISLPPSASAVCQDGRILSLASEPAASALRAGLVPVVLGDVAFDRARGSTIVSTEQVMAYLAAVLHPERVLLAGNEAGVYAEYPKRDALLEVLTPADLEGIAVSGSDQVDVTGGMRDKVRWSIELARTDRAPDVRIFTGAVPGNVRRALMGEAIGTLVRA